MPSLIEQVKTFCAEVDQDTNPDILADHLWRLYATKDPRLGLWFVVDENVVVGHLLAEPVPFDYRGSCDYVLIRQAMVSARNDLRAINREAFKSTVEWSRSLGAKKITMLTHREIAPFMRRWGFTPRKTLMELSL